MPAASGQQGGLRRCGRGLLGFPALRPASGQGVQTPGRLVGALPGSQGAVTSPHPGQGQRGRGSSSGTFTFHSHAAVGPGDALLLQPLKPIIFHTDLCLGPAPTPSTGCTCLGAAGQTLGRGWASRLSSHDKQLTLAQACRPAMWKHINCISISTGNYNLDPLSSANFLTPRLLKGHLCFFHCSTLSVPPALNLWEASHIHVTLSEEATHYLHLLSPTPLTSPEVAQHLSY